MKKSNEYKWTIGVVAVLLIGGAVALAHGYGRDESLYRGTFMGPLPAELEGIALRALGAEYAMYAAYDAVIAQYGKIEPYYTLKEISEHNIELVEEFLGRYDMAYPTENPYLGQTTLPGSLEEIAAELAQRAAEKGALYAEVLGEARYPRGIERFFSYLSRASLKWELPALEVAAQSGGKLTPSQMAGLGFGAERGPVGMMDEDKFCPWHDAMWGGRMGMHGYGWGDCH